MPPQSHEKLIPSAREPRFPKSVRNAPGEFTVNQLPAGEYAFCTSAPGFLATCKWGPGIFANISAGQVVNLPQVRLEPSADLRIRLNDENGLYSAGDVMSGPNVIFGVRTKQGTFHKMTEVSRDKAGVDFRLTVPFDQALTLWVFSRELVLVDETGQAVDTSGPNGEFVVSQGSYGRTFTLNVVSVQQ